MLFTLNTALLHGLLLGPILAETRKYPASSESYPAAEGYVMPKFDWRTSKVFGAFQPKDFYSDWWERLQHNRKTVQGTPLYNIVGIRGSCGERVNAIQFIYKKGNEKDFYGKLCGDTGGFDNPAASSSGKWGYNAVNIAAAEYISKVDVFVCKHGASDRICYLHFHSNHGNSIMECGRRPKPPLKAESVDSNIFPNNRGRLYSAQGHTADEVDMMQLIWVPI